MPVECPICGQRLGDSEAYCGGCGFPKALHREAKRAGEEAEPITVAPVATAARSAPSRRSSPGPGRARDQTAEACARAARELSGHLALLGQLGGNGQPFLGDLRQAALVEAEGKPAESLDLLRAAETRASREVRELFAQRGKELEGRAERLAQQGVQPEIAGALEKLHAALADSKREDAARLVIEADRQLGSLEQDLRGLHGLLEQIEQLREAARGAGHPVDEVDQARAEIRELLGRPKVDAVALDTAAQVAARALMLLNESLPGVLEADLDRHGSVLSTYPPDHEGARRAKAIHAEASRHLRRGRLPDAASRLVELRTAIRELEHAPKPPAAAPAPPVAAAGVPPPEAPDEDALPRLLGKARTLATRVRALAPDSELAFEAAAEIRRATELLRARKLDEADSALTRLMRTLDSETAPEA